MNYAIKRISKAYQKAHEISFDNNTKIVIMSDWHRGNGGLSDDFAKNQNITFAALSYYNENKFIYIEAGDGDELWENKNPADIVEIYSNIYWMLTRFNNDARLYMLYGNHDIIKKDNSFAKKYYAEYFDPRQNAFVPLFDDIKFYESMILNHSGNGKKIFIIHGHQADFFNNSLYRLSRFLVRYLWRPLEMVGINDPTSPAKNYIKKSVIEKHMIKWAEHNNKILIAGHIHKPYMPKIGEAMYFNDGSCVHPRCITAIEIEYGKITLVKWSRKTRDDATLYIGRDILAGPIRINDYYRDVETSNKKHAI